MDEREYYLPPEEPVLPEEFASGREVARPAAEFSGTAHRDEYNEQNSAAGEQETGSRMHKLLKRQMLAPLVATITTVAVVLSSYGVDPLGHDFLVGSSSSSSSSAEVANPARVLVDVGTWETEDGKNVVHFDPGGNGWWCDGYYYGILFWEENEDGSVAYDGYACYIEDDERDGKIYPGSATSLYSNTLHLYRGSGGYELIISCPLPHQSGRYQPASRQRQTPSYVKNAYSRDMSQVLAGLSFTWASSQPSFRPENGDYCLEHLTFDSAGCTGIYTQYVNGEKTAPQTFRAKLNQYDSEMGYPLSLHLESETELEQWCAGPDGTMTSYLSTGVLACFQVAFSTDGVLLVGGEFRNDSEDQSGNWLMIPAGASIPASETEPPEPSAQMPDKSVYGLSHYAEEVGDDAFPVLPNLEPNGYINDYFGVLNEQYIRLQSESEDQFLVAGSAYPGETVTVPGASYDAATNTLTLTNFSGPFLNVNLMGNGFTIKLVGQNELDGIVMWGFNYGGSLTITGSGSLTVNKSMEQPIGLDFRGESSDTCLMVDRDVTLDVYGGVQAVNITGTWMEKSIYYLKPNQLYGGVRHGIKDINGECFGGIVEGPDSLVDATHIVFTPQ